MEVALFIFDYPTIEPRTFQAVNQALEEEPLYGRVEPGVYFIVCRDPKADAFVSDYITRTAQIRTPIPLTFNQLRPALTDKYVLRDLIANTLHRRDLFDYKLPINDDVYFFGRENLVSEIVDQVKKKQNTGVFGLRKTGKTSLLYKVSRHLESNKIAKTIYLDCKSPVIRKKSAISLIDYLVRQIASAAAIPATRYAKLDEFEAFEEVVRLASKRTPFCIIFDEIEYISPFSLTDSHWSKDFIDFWQLMWSTQSRLGHLSFILCGVNAAVCEADTFDKVQNPLFGIVNIKYLQGLDSPSLRLMIDHFGGHMGLGFSKGSVDLLEDHYGGHPLLTRMACSHVHREMESSKKKRPVSITEQYLKSALPECDRDIVPYCTHIVSELRDFYPVEFDVLRMASVGLKSEFLEYGQDADLNRHLRAYGIVRIEADGSPKIVLPVLNSYLRSEHARETGSSISRELVRSPRRALWVSEMLTRIVHDLRTLLQSAPAEIRRPFGSRGIPDADILQKVPVAIDKETFSIGVSKLYNVFYENIIRTYPRGEFFKSFKEEWPDLYRAIDRVRVYRDFTLHLDVSEATRAAYVAYLAFDVDGNDPNSTDEGWFAIQQAILDELLYAAQKELAAKVQ